MVYWARATKTSLQKEGGFIMHFHNVFFLIFFCKKYCRKPYLLLKRKSFVLSIFCERLWVVHCWLDWCGYRLSKSTTSHASNLWCVLKYLLDGITDWIRCCTWMELQRNYRFWFFGVAFPYVWILQVLRFCLWK